DIGCQGIPPFFAGLKDMAAAVAGFHRNAWAEGASRETDVPPNFQKASVGVSDINVSKASAQLERSIRPFTHFGFLEADRPDVGLVTSEELAPGDVVLLFGDCGLPAVAE